MPGSVHASLMYTPDRITSDAGDGAIPITVVWENAGSVDHFWWISEFVPGIDGTIAQTRSPRKVEILPNGANAAILAWRDWTGDDIVEIAWAEREDRTSPTVCPSDDTIEVTWNITQTSTFGDDGDFHCPAGAVTCTGGVAQITSDEAWRPCVGASFASTGGNAYNPNSARPEFVMSRDNRMRFVAINKSVDDEGPMHVHVLRDGLSPLDDWETVYVSPEKHSYGMANVAITDAFGQALTVMQGSDDLELEAIPAVVYRAALFSNADMLDNDITMRAAISYTTGDPTSVPWQNFELTTGTGVPWAATSIWGTTQGVAVTQACLSGDCASNEPGYTTDVPFSAAWTDHRDGMASEVWTRRFPFEDD